MSLLSELLNFLHMNTSTNCAGYEQDHALQYVYVGLCQHVSLSVFPETFYETLHAPLVPSCFVSIH